MDEPRTEPVDFETWVSARVPAFLRYAYLVAGDGHDALGRAAPADDRPDVSDTDEMWRACLALPRQQRVALVLRFYEDLSFAQIAAILDCAEATARSHVHRGLAGLRGVIGRLPTDEGRPDEPAR